MKKIHSFFILLNLFFLLLTIKQCEAQSSSEKTLWQIGKADNSDAEFALAPSGYDKFLEKDFGWEDKYYVIGNSDSKKNCAYILPGPQDDWGGSNGLAGWHAASLNILFKLNHPQPQDKFNLIIDLMDISAKNPPLLKVTVNDSSWEYQLPAGSGDSTIKGVATKYPGHVIKIEIPANTIKKRNEINIASIWGSWLIFDQVRLDGPKNISAVIPKNVFIKNVRAANYEINDEGKIEQPLLIDVQHLSGKPVLTAFVDNKKIFEETLEKGDYIFEAPMPATDAIKQSNYEIKINNEVVDSGTIQRSSQKLITPADYVNTMIGSGHSRWMIAPGPWMPFSMVKLSPDNQNVGWQSGYDPIFESIGGFSHIHEWTMSGLSMMPVNGPLITYIGDQSNPDDGYRSKINKQSEEAPLGYYKVFLSRYNTTAELTATTRCSFQRYTFPNEDTSRVLIDFTTPAEYNYLLQDVEVKKINDYRIEGFSKQKAPDVWSKGIDQDYTIHFVIDFDKPIINVGSWMDSSVQKNITQFNAKDAKHTGVFVEFNTNENNVVQVRTGISYVSTKNAEENLEQEIIQPFDWNFDKVRKNNVDTWNKLLERVAISTDDRREKIRFYTNMYRALCRNTYSDVNGDWMDATGNLQHLKDTDAVALGCDAFWNTFWNLNQFWNLVTPEWSSRWVKSQLAMYDANGALAKGPAGMKYIPVMVAEHEIPLMVSAYQMGIRDYDVSKMFEAVKKMETKPAWKIGNGLAGNRDLEAFLKYKYVPADKGRFSNTLEYAYDNWTVAQLAKSLNKQDDFKIFDERGNWWKNAIDTATGYARLKNADGKWVKNFDAFRSGANSEYVEGNAWQLTYFVPQDVPGLIKQIGKERFVNRLTWGFEQSYAWRFNSPGEQYWRFPVVQGNQQSMQFAFLFNYAGKPWLTQKWSRAILDRYYGYGLSNAYLGDEDQGQMSAWFVMAALGLFQTDGGCNAESTYEIASPLYKKVTIDLGNRFGRGKTFTIIANNVSRENMYIQSAILNGKPLNSFMFPASELLKGGELVLQMRSSPGKWGITL